jgi:hypothetical protein
MKLFSIYDTGKGEKADNYIMKHWKVEELSKISSANTVQNEKKWAPNLWQTHSTSELQKLPLYA